jgi:hypothetical protein
MDYFSPVFVAIGIVFAAFFVLIARLILGRTGSPLLWAYALVTVVFVYLLPAQEYSLDVDAAVLLLAHLLFLAHLVALLLTARTGAAKGPTLVSRAGAVSGGVVAAVVIGWFTVRAYLVAVYGPAALMFSRSQVIVSAGFVEFSTWEVALSSITTLLLMGVFLAAAIKHAAGIREQSKLLALVTVASLIVVILTNESPIGSRRLLLVLGAVWLATVWGLPASSSGRSRKVLSPRIVLLAATVVGLAVYYQYVRQNDFREILEATSATELVAATARFATTIPPKDTAADIQHMRPGPFDFFSRVVHEAVAEDKSSRGEATALSIAIAVPKVLYPDDKPTGDVDEVLLDKLGIEPTKPFLNIDYPTSLSAIFVADFGLLGMIPAAAVLGLGFYVIGMLIKGIRQSPFSLLIAFGVSVQLIGSQEMGLTAMLATFRDAVLAWVVLLPCSWVWTQIRRKMVEQSYAARKNMLAQGREQFGSVVSGA